MENDIRNGWVLGTDRLGPCPDEYYLRHRGTATKYFLGTNNSKRARSRADILMNCDRKGRRKQVKEWQRNRNIDGKRTLEARREMQR